MMTKRRTLGTLAGFAVSAALLALALYQVDLEQVAQAIAQADFRLVLVSAAFTLSSYFLRTLRWRRLLLPQKAIPATRLFPVLVIGFALNNVLPGRPGEFARGILLGQRERLSKTLGIATVIVERVFDGLTLIAVLIGLAFVIELPGWGSQVEALAVLLFGFALAFLVFLLWRENDAVPFLRRIIQLAPPRVAQRMTDMLASFIRGLHSLRSARDVAAISTFSVLVWAAEGISYFLVLSAFSLFPTIPERLFAALFMMVIVNLGILIPAAPGGVGPFEAAGILALSAFGLTKDQALPPVLVSHMVQYTLITGLGIFFLAREGIKLTQAVEAIEAEQSAEEAQEGLGVMG